MKAVAISVLAFAAQTYAHGYVYRVTADNTVYPGWDIFVDPTITPAPKRIAYGGTSPKPITATNTSDLACNLLHSPIPGAIAEVRAGSTVTFHWSAWLHSHKGPITAWLAPYSGDISNVDINQLEFFKFAEETTDAKGKWWNDRFIDQDDNTWNVTIPSDIKSGSYVLRHEIVALHYALIPSPGPSGGLAPQFYPVCFNFKVTGDGNSVPKGLKFPGAYNLEDPGLHYNVTKIYTTPYPSLGQPVYKSSRNVTLVPKDRVVISPTSSGSEADTAYYHAQNLALLAQANQTRYFDSIGG